MRYHGTKYQSLGPLKLDESRYMIKVKKLVWGKTPTSRRRILKNQIKYLIYREWVKCVTRTRTRVGKPALGFYESLKNIYNSKTIAVKAQN